MSDDGLFVSKKGIDERVDKAGSGFSRDKPLNKDFLDTVEDEQRKILAEKKKLIGSVGGMYTDFCDYYNLVHLNFFNLSKVCEKVAKDVDSWSSSLGSNGRFVRGDRYDKDYDFQLELYKTDKAGDGKISFEYKMKLSEHYFDVDKDVKLKDERGYFVKKTYNLSDVISEEDSFKSVKRYHDKISEGIMGVEESSISLIVERPGETLRYRLPFKNLKNDTLADIGKDLFVKLVRDEPIHLKSLVEKYL